MWKKCYSSKMSQRSENSADVLYGSKCPVVGFVGGRIVKAPTAAFRFLLFFPCPLPPSTGEKYQNPRLFYRMWNVGGVGRWEGREPGQCWGPFPAVFSSRGGGDFSHLPHFPWGMITPGLPHFPISNDERGLSYFHGGATPPPPPTP